MRMIAVIKISLTNARPPFGVWDRHTAIFVLNAITIILTPKGIISDTIQIRNLNNSKINISIIKAVTSAKPITGKRRIEACLETRNPRTQKPPRLVRRGFSSKNLLCSFWCKPHTLPASKSKLDGFYLLNLTRKPFQNSW